MSNPSCIRQLRSALAEIERRLEIIRARSQLNVSSSNSVQPITSNSSSSVDNDTLSLPSINDDNEIEQNSQIIGKWGIFIF